MFNLRGRSGWRISPRSWIMAVVLTCLMAHSALTVTASRAGAAARALSIVLAVDTGSSMRVDFDHVRDGLRRFVQRLAPADRVELCSFGSRPECAPFTRDHRNVLETIRGLSAHNDARLFDSIERAIDDVRLRDGRRVVVVFAMEPDWRWSASPRRVLRDALSAGVTVYAVGLDVRYFDGDEFVDGKPDPNLEGLAKKTGGKFIEVTRNRDIPSEFDRLARQLQAAR